MTNWGGFYEEGAAYRHTLKKALNRPEIFTPVIMHNLSAMAIEKFFMALLVSRGRMPDNHTLTDLVNAVEKTLPVDRELSRDLAFMDSLQQICSMDHYEKAEMTGKEVPVFVSACDRVFDMVQPLLFGGDAAEVAQ